MLMPARFAAFAGKLSKVQKNPGEFEQLLATISIIHDYEIIRKDVLAIGQNLVEETRTKLDYPPTKSQTPTVSGPKCKFSLFPWNVDGTVPGQEWKNIFSVWGPMIRNHLCSDTPGIPWRFIKYRSGSCRRALQEQAEQPL